INWAGVVGGSSTPQTFKYGGTTIATSSINLQTNPVTGAVTPTAVPQNLPQIITNTTTGTFQPQDFLRNGEHGLGGLLRAASGQPEISNKAGYATFTFAGSTVASPIIDKRTLDSNVLIKSGDTLAIGGLLQDEVTKGRTKVPVLGDIPVIGYAFQERLNTRTKRNLLIFVTPTIIQQGYGTGLEDQVSGLHHSGEEYADPNGWRNNAKGSVRILPTSNRQVAADYPKPGMPVPPAKTSVK